MSVEYVGPSEEAIDIIKHIVEQNDKILDALCTKQLLVIPNEEYSDVG